MNQQICSFFIRPPRQTYFDHDLGPQIFPLNTKIGYKTKMGTRKDFSILNNRNYKISASYYQVQTSNSNKCLVYLHTHHGSRLQATCLIQPMLNANINLCLFDFCGYGNSQGDTVTLGIQQANDIRCVIDFLMKNCSQQKFILWGRSMGAVASLIYLSKIKSDCHEIIGAIFDSPFHSLYQLTVEIGSKNIGVPETFLRPFIFLIKKSLENRLNFEQLQLQPIASSINIPCIFITSKQDKFVSYTHSERLYKKYAGPKQLIYIQKDHNQPRKQEDLSQIFSFIWRKFNINLKTQKQEEGHLKLINVHLNFIQKYQNAPTELIDYFQRNSQENDNQPVTQRLQYPLCFQRQNFSMRPSPQKKISSASIKYFKNNYRVQRMKNPNK